MGEATVEEGEDTTTTHPLCPTWEGLPCPPTMACRLPGCSLHHPLWAREVHMDITWVFCLLQWA